MVTGASCFYTSDDDGLSWRYVSTIAEPEDLGDGWSEPFVVRGDAYCWDCGYPVAVELADGRIFTVYYLSTAEGDEPVHAQACVRYVAGTLFRLQHLPKAD